MEIKLLHFVEFFTGNNELITVGHSKVEPDMFSLGWNGDESAHIELNKEELESLHMALEHFLETL